MTDEEISRISGEDLSKWLTKNLERVRLLRAKNRALRKCNRITSQVINQMEVASLEEVNEILANMESWRIRDDFDCEHQ